MMKFLSLIEFYIVFRGVLHSNPMDYAWGANGLDAIITQVLLGNCLSNLREVLCLFIVVIQQTNSYTDISLHH